MTWLETNKNYVGEKSSTFSIDPECYTGVSNYMELCLMTEVMTQKDEQGDLGV
jgi:hypothetical protein